MCPQSTIFTNLACPKPSSFFSNPDSLNHLNINTKISFYLQIKILESYMNSLPLTQPRMEFFQPVTWNNNDDKNEGIHMQCLEHISSFPFLLPSPSQGPTAIQLLQQLPHPLQLSLPTPLTSYPSFHTLPNKYLNPCHRFQKFIIICTNC